MPLKVMLNHVHSRAKLAPEVFYSGGQQSQRYNEAYHFVEVDVHDGRALDEVFDLHRQGFVLRHSPSHFETFDDADALANLYYREVAALVKNESGADHVFVFDHTIRRGQEQSLRKPAHHVHNDYTEGTGKSRARAALGEEIYSAMAGKRMIQVNVWRPLVDEVERSPLAFCDAQSIDKQDLINATIHFTDTKHIGEIFALRQNAKQRWVYFSQMTRDEVVLIKGYDTLLQKGLARFTPHSAFEYPDQNPEAPDRESIETRTFAFYDD